MDEGWADQELEGIALGDARLNRRAKKLLHDLGAKPTPSIPVACGGWAETQAAYRLLAHPEVRLEDILTPHVASSFRRAAAHRVVLCLQDTTELDFNGQQIAGLGPLSYAAQRGAYVHPTLLVTPEREALGVANAWLWSRAAPKDSDWALPAGAKESVRWIESYERLAERAPDLPDTRLVMVGDREADLRGLMERAADLGQPVDWLVRATHDRVTEAPEGLKLWEGFTAAHQVGTFEFTLPARPGQGARDVRQAVSVRRCSLRRADGPALSVTAVLAREIEPPAGQAPIIWRLLTNRIGAGADLAREALGWYLARWEIELFFNVLKTGCRVEALQLARVERLECALAFYLIIAWRVLWLMRLGRTCPDLACEVVFAPEEWQAAYLVARKPLPATPPRLNDVIRVIASFGGFLGRTRDGEPGAKSLWIGLQRVMDFAAGIHAARTCV
jgi:hypothetical protein